VKCVLWVTEACNLRCKYCYINAGYKVAPTESLESIIRLIDWLTTIRIEKLIIGGGEPLLRKDIFDILKRSAKTAETHLLTNGTLINEKSAQKLVLSGIDSVSVSLDSPAPEVHNEFRNGSFDAAVGGIKLCVKNGLSVDIAACIHKKNSTHAASLIRFAENIGAASVTFEGLNPVGRGENCKDWTLTAKQTDIFLQSVYDTLHDIKPSVQVIIFYPQWVRWDRNAPGCEAGKNFFGLRSNGDVFPCTNLPITVGNVWREDFSSIWNCKLMNDLRTKRNGGCNRCRYRERCGGCRSKAYAAGDMFGSDPSCPLAWEGDG